MTTIEDVKRIETRQVELNDRLKALDERVSEVTRLVEQRASLRTLREMRLTVETMSNATITDVLEAFDREIADVEARVLIAGGKL